MAGEENRGLDLDAKEVWIEVRNNREEIHPNDGSPGSGEGSDSAPSSGQYFSASEGDSENRYQLASDPAGTIMQRVHTIPRTMPIEHQMQQRFRDDGMPVTPPADALPGSWRKQCIELDAVRKNYDALEVRYAKLAAENEDKDRELQAVHKVKNGLALQVKDLKEGWDRRESAYAELHQSQEPMRQRVLRAEGEVREKQATYDSLTDFNTILRTENNNAKNSLKARDRTIEELKKRAKNCEDELLRSKGLETELKQLKKDLEKCHKENSKLVDERREWEMDSGRLHVDMERNVVRFQRANELYRIESVDGTDDEEEVEHTPIDAADTTTGTQALSPEGDEGQTSVDTLASNSKSEARRPIQKVDAEADADGTGTQITDTGTQTANTSTQIADTGTQTANTDTQTADTGTQTAESTTAIGEKTSEARPPIQKLDAEADADSTGTQTAESMNAGGEKSLETSGDTEASMETENTENRSKESQPDFGLGISGVPGLDMRVNDDVAQMIPPISEVGQDDTKSVKGSQTEGQQTAGTTVEGKRNTETGNDSEVREKQRARAASYSSTEWWLVLLCVALGWWLWRAGQEDKQLWMQANELTRQTVVGLRDERWARPMWLARMSFDAENMLGIDRSMLA